jgi:hypothetical protein
LLDVAPEAMTLEYARKVAPRVSKLVEGKSIKELYEEFGIIKPRKASDQDYLDRQARVDAKAPRTDEEKQMLFAEEFWGEVEHSLDNFAKYFDGGLRDEEVKIKTREKAVARLSELIEQLTGGKVEVIYE